MPLFEIEIVADIVMLAAAKINSIARRSRSHRCGNRFKGMAYRTIAIGVISVWGQHNKCCNTQDMPQKVSLPLKSG